jgi:hypothetical protein
VGRGLAGLWHATQISTSLVFVAQCLKQMFKGKQQEGNSKHAWWTTWQCVPDRCVPERRVSDVPCWTMRPMDNTIRPLDDASLGRCVPWRMRHLDDASLGRCVPWMMRPLVDASLKRCVLGRCVPWTICPLDYVSLGRCVPWKMRLLDDPPDRLVPTLGHIEAHVKQTGPIQYIY